MKKLIVLISLVFFIPCISFAAIPIKDIKVNSYKIEKDVVNPIELTESHVKSRKIDRIFKKVFKKVEPEKRAKSDRNILNVLSFVSSALAIIALIVGGGLLTIPLSIAGVILGIIGLSKRQRLEGLGIAGVILGGGILILTVLLISLIISLF